MTRHFRRRPRRRPDRPRWIELVGGPADGFAVPVPDDIEEVAARLFRTGVYVEFGDDPDHRPTACLTPYRRAGRRTASGLEAFEASLKEK
jgi:hypothetical protein